jgi:hypothetical protein
MGGKECAKGTYLDRSRHGAINAIEQHVDAWRTEHSRVQTSRWRRTASHRFIEIASMLQRIRRIDIVTSVKLFKWFSGPDQAAVEARAVLRSSGIHLLLAATALYSPTKETFDSDNNITD